MQERVEDRRDDRVHRVFEDASAAREGLLDPLDFCFIERFNYRVHGSRSQDSNVNASATEARFLDSKFDRASRANF